MPNRVGQDAGFVSRLLAFALDIGVSIGLFALAVALVSSIIGLLAGHSVNVNRHGVVVEVLFGVWGFFYFAFQWGSNGRTIGMALFGVRVVTTDGRDISRWRALGRTAALPLSFLFLGLGFLMALFQHERRALHDLIAGTCVVYSSMLAPPDCAGWHASRNPNRCRQGTDPLPGWRETPAKRSTFDLIAATGDPSPSSEGPSRTGLSVPEEPVWVAATIQ